MSVRWLVPDQVVQVVTVVSEATPWQAHWDPEFRRTRRCGGVNCELCVQGVPIQTRWVVLVLDTLGVESTFELRERHRGLVKKAEGMYGSFSGSVISIRKAGGAKNSPVEVELVDRKNVEARQVAKLIQTLGLPPRVRTVNHTQSIETELERVAQVSVSRVARE